MNDIRAGARRSHFDMAGMVKALTGGPLPLAITLIPEKISSAFEGAAAEGKVMNVLRLSLAEVCGDGKRIKDAEEITA